MPAPLVSICLPNLNNRPFLEERVETIFAQTYRNWELVISDNYSDDGAWEFFEELARKDERVLIAQAPRAGLYPNWNNCLRRATGDYVYVATSDDTMAPDCLEKMVAALETHRECDLAHCPLVIIDEKGKPLDDPWWPRLTLFGRTAGPLVSRPHIRRAPFDGLLPLTGEFVYFSITHLLMRRSLFERTGEFLSRWGSVGDFNWYMKAGLCASTVHVPDTWASLRMHAKQATASANLYSKEYYQKVEEMIADALDTCGRHVAPEVISALEADWTGASKTMRAHNAMLALLPTKIDRRLYQAKQLLLGPSMIRRDLAGRVTGGATWSSAAPSSLLQWLEPRVSKPLIEPA
jgi:glycosyltransferase involved in cell wall biosynthesis